jgi:hypothetical protein
MASAAIEWKPDRSLLDTSIRIPAEPKPRRESQRAWSERIIKTINGSDPRCNAVLGKHFGDGYAIIATDGHRALCRLQPGEPGPMLMASVTDHASITVGPDLFMALKRARAVTLGRRTRSAVLSICSGRLYVSVSDQDGIDSAEWIDVGSEAIETSGIILDIDLMLAGLGRPEMRLWYRPNAWDVPIKIETDDREYRYVLMPMRP